MSNSMRRESSPPSVNPVSADSGIAYHVVTDEKFPDLNRAAATGGKNKKLNLSSRATFADKSDSDEDAKISGDARSTEDEFYNNRKDHAATNETFLSTSSVEDNFYPDLETQPIADNLENPNENKTADTAIIITTAVASYGIVMPSISASESCVTRPTCGSFLGPLNHEGVFVYGAAANSVVTNTFYAATSAPATWRFFKNQSKVAKLGTLLFVTSQMMQEFYISEGTDSAAWATVLAMLGAIPGALFAFKHFMESRFGADWLLQKKYEVRLLFTRLYPLKKDSEKNIKYYADLQASFTAKLQAKFSALLATVGTPAFPLEHPQTKTDKMLFLLRTATPTTQFAPPSKPRWLLDKFGNLVCTGLGSIGLMPTLENTYTLLDSCFTWLSDGMVRSIVVPPLKAIGTTALGTKQIFSTLFFMGNIDIKKPGETLAWHFHRCKTMFAMALITTWSLVSYASTSAMFEKNYNESDKTAVRPIADVGVIFLHFVTALNLWGLLCKELFAKNPQEILLREIENEITRVKKMTYLQFEAYVKEEGRKYDLIALNLQPVAVPALPPVTITNTQAAPVRVSPSFDDEREPEFPRVRGAVPQGKPASNSWYQSCLSFFCCRKKPNVEEAAPGNVAKYQPL